VSVMSPSPAVVGVDTHLVNGENVGPQHDVERCCDPVLQHMGQHVFGHRRVDGVGMGAADEVVVRPLRRMGWCREHLPALVHLLIATQIADRVEHGMVGVGLHHHAVVLQNHQRLVVQHALLPEADVAKSTGYLATGHVVVGHFDHRGHTAVVRGRLDRVLDAVVGVPSIPHSMPVSSQLSAARSAFCIDISWFGMRMM
jgi:hypothetical protein